MTKWSNIRHFKPLYYNWHFLFSNCSKLKLLHQIFPLLLCLPMWRLFYSFQEFNLMYLIFVKHFSFSVSVKIWKSEVDLTLSHVKLWGFFSLSLALKPFCGSASVESVTAVFHWRTLKVPFITKEKTCSEAF